MVDVIVWPLIQYHRLNHFVKPDIIIKTCVTWNFSYCVVSANIIQMNTNGTHGRQSQNKIIRECCQCCLLLMNFRVWRECVFYIEENVFDWLLWHEKSCLYHFSTFSSNFPVNLRDTYIINLRICRYNLLIFRPIFYNYFFSSNNSVDRLNDITGSLENYLDIHSIDVA